MNSLFKRSEFKYFVIETGKDFTIIFPNESTYEDTFDGTIEPYFLTKDDDAIVNNHLHGILTKPIENYGSNDGEEVIVKLHKAIYDVLGHNIKQYVIMRYGNPSQEWL
jgi:hypothetical protein